MKKPGLQMGAIITSGVSLVRPLAAVILACAFAFVCPSGLIADIYPPFCDKAEGGLGSTSTTGIHFRNSKAHLGDTVQVFPVLGMVSGACQAQHGTGQVYIASGLLVTFLNDVTLTPGAIYDCPTNTTPPCTPGPYNVTIVNGLVGAGVTYPKGFIGATPNTIRAVQWCVSNEVRSSPSGFETFDYTDTDSILIVHPCIQVVKQCVLPQGRTCYGPSEAVVFVGYVTNCGDNNLTNVIAVDSRAGPLVLQDPSTGFPLNVGNPTGPVSLGVGAYATYTTTIMPTLTETCLGVTSGSATVTGKDTSDFGGPNAWVTNSASATCPLCMTPCISVMKACSGPVGDPQTISIAVSNCGNITLTNVTITDNLLGVVTNVGYLPPGQGFSYTNTFTSTNTVTASGTTLCGQGVQASASATCPPRVSLSLSNRVATLVWTSIPGKSYRVQYRPDLSSGTAWSNLAPDVVASGFSATNQDNTLGTAGQRFYRVVALP